MSDPSKPHILIVGAGAWGASTAVSLLKSGNYTVTLIDRASVLPAEGAASTDINKIVRFDYEQDVYADLAFEDLGKWREKEWEGMYHERGPVTRLPDSASPQRALDPSGKGVSGDMSNRHGYANPAGGWVDAAKATGYLIKQTTELGGTVIPGAEAEGFILDNGDVWGVITTDGKELKADKTIVSAGAWTDGLMRGILPEGLITNSAITVAAFKLSEEEYERYKDIPVIMGWDETAFYSMPPTLDRMLKFGLPEAGYTCSTGRPRTTLTPGASEWHDKNKATWLPRKSFNTLRQVTELYFPEFKDRPFDFTRMCPTPATFDEHFVIDYHPSYPSLIIASGGDHHSYTMMPVIGDLVLARLENTLDSARAQLWAIRKPTKGDTAWHASKNQGRTDVDSVEFANVDEISAGEGGVPLSAKTGGSGRSLLDCGWL